MKFCQKQSYLHLKKPAKSVTVWKNSKQRIVEVNRDIFELVCQFINKQWARSEFWKGQGRS